MTIASLRICALVKIASERPCGNGLLAGRGRSSGTDSLRLLSAAALRAAARLISAARDELRPFTCLVELRRSAP